MTNIEWTDATWNPIRGCSRVSRGCERCYAERQAMRHAGPGRAYEGLVRTVNGHPAWTGEVRCLPGKLAEPLRWRKPRRVFVNSMGDLFHESVPDEFILRVFATMTHARQHIFQILTKRPERMRAWCQHEVSIAPDGFPLPNVWLGVSVEDQRAADERMPLLLQTPAAVRFVSCEPLLGAVDLSPWLAVGGAKPVLDESGYNIIPGRAPMRPIDWVIIGGESGPGARSCDVAWIRSIVRQCRAARVPCFIKQLGARPYDSERGPLTTPTDVRLHLDDRKGADMAEWPPDLQVREWPA